jgi:hypothetical protein
MQSAGGKEGPTVPLCGACHDEIHAVAINLESKQARREMTFSPEEWTRAKRLVEYLQLAIRKNKNDPNGDDPARVTIVLTKRELFFLHLIKKDGGHSNLTSYVTGLVRGLIRSRFPGA